MRSRMRAGFLALTAVGTMLGGTAWADVTTDLSGSILVFPKVIADGTRDTAIQISNTSNSLVRAHCFYVNASLRDPTKPEGPLNKRIWQEVDFDITLTRQQPTFWLVSEGRNVNPFDPTCAPTGVCIGGDHDGEPCTDGSVDCYMNGYCSNTGCFGAGFDPGLIPPVVPDFTGELKCVEVDDSGAPLSGNHLKGEATLMVSRSTNTTVFGFDEVESATLPKGEQSEYNALAILGAENNGDGTLVLGGGQCVGEGALHGQVCRSDEECSASGPCAQEYNACPEAWTIDHFAEGAPNPVIEGIRFGPDRDKEYPDPEPSTVYTELTVVPCTQNYETQQPTSVTLQFETWDEFESQYSASTTVTCWGSFFFEELGSPALTFPGTLVPDPSGTMFLQTRIRSAAGTPFGMMIVGETFMSTKTNAESMKRKITAAALNLHVEGERSVPDIITIPDEQLAP